MSTITFETSKRRQRWAEHIYGERCRRLVRLVERGTQPHNLIWVFRAWRKRDKTTVGVCKLKKIYGIYYMPKDWYEKGALRIPKYENKHVIVVTVSRDVRDEELLWTIAHEYKHYLQHLTTKKKPMKFSEMSKIEIEADKFANGFVSYENPNIRKWSKYPTLEKIWKEREKPPEESLGTKHHNGVEAGFVNVSKLRSKTCSM